MNRVLSRILNKVLLFGYVNNDWIDEDMNNDWVKVVWGLGVCKYE